MTTRLLMNGSLAARGLLGAAAYLAPTTTARSLGINPTDNPALPYLARVFGARDIVLAILGATATGQARRNLVLAMAAIDTFDITSALLGRRGRYLTTPAATALAAVAVLALVPELIELNENRE